MTGLTRRDLVVGSAVAAATIAGPGIRRAHAVTTIFRVGYQKFGNLARLKASGQLEEKLDPLDAVVTWTQFPTGTALAEALAAGTIDVGSTGETPPIFAQAAGAPITYFACEPPAPRGEAILVKEESPFAALSDLKGKKVAFNKGSNVHYLYLKVLQTAGLAQSEVTPVYLPPTEGQAAFDKGEVDAWAIWDPFLAAAQLKGGVRTLVDGDGLVANRQFYLGSRRRIDSELLGAFRESVMRIDRRTAFDPVRTAEIMSPEIGMPLRVVTRAVQRQGWDLQPMDAKLVAAQQEIADAFFKAGLIPKAIKISDALA